MTLYAVGRRFVVAFALGCLVAADASAVQVTLNLVQQQSSLSLNGEYAANQFYSQDDPSFPNLYPGVVDGDPANPSNRTTLTGTITVDVDNVMAPTSIQILSASMDATVTGSWLPEPQPEAGATSAGTTPGTAAPADIAIKIVSDFGVPECCDIAYAVLRDATYNLVTQTLDTDGGGPITPMPVVEPVNAQGEFSSQSQFLSYSSGFFEYWADPFLLNERDRDNVTGDGAPNQYDVDQTTSPDTFTPIADAPKSTYVVSGGIATLTIPVESNIFDDLSQFVTGQFVATFEIPTGLDGDYNEDGVVDGADYVTWRKTPSAFGGDPAGYNTWRQNFGAGGAGGGGAVPEPTCVILAALGLASVLLLRGRRSCGSCFCR